MKVVIEAYNTPQIWKLKGAVKLRIYADQSFWTSDGQWIPQGSPGSPNTHYLEVTCDVTGDVLTVPSFEIDSTVDALDGTQATYTAEIAASNKRVPFMQNFAVNTLEAGDPSMTWAEIALFRTAFNPQQVSDPLLRQLNAMISLAAGSLTKASETNTGVTALSFDPNDPVFPIAVSDTDPRVPTQDENNALLGTSGDPGLTNRYVTDSDSRLLPVRKVYASKVAILNSNIATGGGVDVTALLQAVLDTATAASPLELVMDGVALISGLDVRSHTTISGMNGGGFYLKNGGARAAIRNLNRTSGAIVDKNIILRDFMLNGNYANQSKFEAGGAIVGGQFEAGTIFNCAIQLFGVQNLTLQNLKVSDSKNWPIHLANFDRVAVRDVWLVNTEVPMDNHDGIHVNGPGKNLAIDNLRLTGMTDDGIALNADDGASNSAIVAPGAITDVAIRNLFLDSSAFGVRVISNGQRVDRIAISNIYGTVTQYGYILHIDDLSYYFGGGTGNIGRVSLDGVDVTVTAGATGPWSEAVRVEAQIEELSVTNFRQGANWYPDYRPIIRVLNSSVTKGYGNVKMLRADFDVYDPPGTDTLPASSYAAPRLKVEGNVENLIYHINHYRDPTVNQGMGAFQIDTSDINKGVTNMHFSGVVTRQTNTLVLTSGKFTNLRIDNLIDLDNGGVTLLVNTPGATVATPRVSASGVSLNGGTFLGGGGTVAVCTQTSGWNVSFDGLTARGIPLIAGATPSVRGLGQVKTNNGGATTITNFTLGYPGQTLIVVMGDGNTTIQNNANIITRSGADITPANGKTYSFISTAADVWRQLN